MFVEKIVLFTHVLVAKVEHKRVLCFLSALPASAPAVRVTPRGLERGALEVEVKGRDRTEVPEVSRGAEFNIALASEHHGHFDLKMQLEIQGDGKGGKKKEIEIEGERDRIYS